MLNAPLNEIAPQTHFTQVSSFFDIVDNLVKVGDTDKKYYMSKVPCTSPPAPITENGWTCISLMPKGGNMVDLYNSFIYVKIRFTAHTLSPPGRVASGTNRLAPIYWVGFKDAMDCISAYQIHCNGEEIYSQSHALRESFITSVATPDTVKKGDPWSKTIHEDVWNREGTFRTGKFLEVAAAADTSNKYWPNLYIELKIDFRRFLPLSGIKYLPAFVQNLQLKVQFSTRGMVCANVGYQQLLINPAYMKNITNIDKITNTFSPINTEFKCYGGGTTDFPQLKDGSSTAVKQQLYLNAGDFVIEECCSYLHTFSIDRNIYLSLIERYTANALVFPIQTLNVMQTNGTFLNSQTHINFTVQIIPRFVDAIFFFFPLTREHETCFFNPELTNIQISMGDFGAYRFPATDACPAFYEVVTNCLNLNNDIIGPPRAFMNAYTIMDNTQDGWKSEDCSDFVFGIPCSVDNTFQQGQTSQSIVAYTFEADVLTSSPFYNSTCVPEFATLSDGVFAIQVIPGGGVVCRIKELDISTPAE